MITFIEIKKSHIRHGESERVVNNKQRKMVPREHHPPKKGKINNGDQIIVHFDVNVSLEFP